jgi:hypothetical protein
VRYTCVADSRDLQRRDPGHDLQLPYQVSGSNVIGIADHQHYVRHRLKVAAAEA